MLPQRKSNTKIISSTSRLSRSAKLSVAALKIAARAIYGRTRVKLLPKAKREAQIEINRRKASENFAQTLAGMKGLAAKLGQMASYLDESLPQETRNALAQLQADMPAMDYEVTSQVIYEQLGKIPSRIFSYFEEEPFAAASIGQVHRAVTKSGVPVAVKVQYPGIEKALNADMSNASMLFHAIGLMFPHMDPKPIVQELSVRLKEEVDYQIEADNQRLFETFYHSHPFISIPLVVDELTSTKVLTTEFAEGVRFSEILSWGQEDKDWAGEVIFRFVFRSLYSLCAFNGDPHPGNYLFTKSRKVTFLDFGLVKRFTPEESFTFNEMVRTMITDRDEEGFRKTIVGAGLLKEGANVSTEQVIEYFSTFYELVKEPKPYSVTPELSTKLLRTVMDPSSPVAKFATVPPAFVLIQRINLGIYALLAQLRATANWRDIAEELWPHVSAAPKTKLGELEQDWLSLRP